MSLPSDPLETPPPQGNWFLFGGGLLALLGGSLWGGLTHLFWGGLAISLGVSFLGDLFWSVIPLLATVLTVWIIPH